ncbi:hypothetical protein N9L24_03645 [Candidatus Marinamargulisbacteria bacterium]|nr:hypothetical protein [Candidatus Marinamargulisbacteria bacterium]
MTDASARASCVSQDIGHWIIHRNGTRLLQVAAGSEGEAETPGCRIARLGAIQARLYTIPIAAAIGARSAWVFESSVRRVHASLSRSNSLEDRLRLLLETMGSLTVTSLLAEINIVPAAYPDFPGFFRTDDQSHSHDRNALPDGTQLFIEHFVGRLALSSSEVVLGFCVVVLVYSTCPQLLEWAGSNRGRSEYHEVELGPL